MYFKIKEINKDHYTHYTVPINLKTMYTFIKNMYNVSIHEKETENGEFEYYIDIVDMESFETFNKQLNHINGNKSIELIIDFVKKTIIL